MTTRMTGPTRGKNGGHGKAGAPKAPAKGEHGIEIMSVNKDDSDDNEIQVSAPGNRRCSEPWWLLPSGAKSV